MRLAVRAGHVASVAAPDATQAESLQCVYHTTGAYVTGGVCAAEPAPRAAVEVIVLPHRYASRALHRSQFMYVVGSDRKRRRFRIVRFDRCPPNPEARPPPPPGVNSNGDGSSGSGDVPGPTPPRTAPPRASGTPPLPKRDFTCLEDIVYEYPGELSSDVSRVFSSHVSLTCWEWTVGSPRLAPHAMLSADVSRTSIGSLRT